MSPRSPSIDRSPGSSSKRKESAFALVIVLALLVLLLVAVLAYFSRTSLQRQISSSSASSAEAEMLAQIALAIVMEDFAAEIEAGSEPEDPAFAGAEISLKRPRWVLDTALGRYISPSMTPQHVGNTAIPSIVKTSRKETSFFSLLPGYANSPQGTVRASGISTDTPSRNGRRYDIQRWNAARLLTEEEMGNFVVPDWIYVSRDGSNPTDLSSSTLLNLRDQRADNAQSVIGRFAYVVYDTGGLIDINTVGNALLDTDNATRGRLHQVSLKDGIGDVPLPDFSQFIGWRWPASASNAAAENGGLFDPKRTFIDVAAGEQAFVTRQDLINYTSQPNSPIPATALPYLTTRARDLNAPAFAPDPAAPTIPEAYFESGDTPQSELNPDLLGPTVRFTQDVVLARPDAPVKVRAGSPVMSRRFPLAKLSILSEDDPDPEELLYYFGLVKRPDGRLLYDTARIGWRLATLKSVAAYRDGTIADPEGSGNMLPKAREPNFFEVIQAVVAAGSLGKSGSSPEFTAKLMGKLNLNFNGHHLDNTANLAHDSDHLRFRQALQIGANLIDQWDANDFPTTILYPAGVSGQYIESYGVENLPYITQFSTTPYRPNYAFDGAGPRDCLHLWALFDVWNPHQNAKASSGIEEFRIICSRGKTSATVLLSVSDTLLPDDNRGTGSFISSDGITPNISTSFPNSVDTSPDGGTKHTQRLLSGYSADGAPRPSSTLAMKSVKELNEGFGLELKFPPAAYAEPTTIGSGEPTKTTDVPGVLLAHQNFSKVAIESVDLPRPNPAIPAKADRSKNMQRTLNHWYDMAKMFPYRVWRDSGGSEVTVRTFNSGDAFARCVVPAFETENANGDRVYPAGSIFEFPNGSASHWVVEPPLVFSGTSSKSDPTTGTTTVYARIGVKAHNYIRVNPQQVDPLVFDLQAKINGQWMTYQRLEGLFLQGKVFQYSMPKKDTLLQDTHHSTGAPLEGFYSWMGVTTGKMYGAATYSKIDPRSSRFGLSETEQNIMGHSPRTTPDAWNGTWVESTPSRWTIGFGDYVLGKNLVLSSSPAGYAPAANAPGFENFWSPTTPAFYGLVANHPGRLDAAYPMRYADIDGVVRPADGYWGSLPTVPGRTDDRPIVLNRPLRSVGELGYVFRDTPWKTLDLSTSASGDIGLLDAFSLDESVQTTPLTAGKVNLNTARPEVLSTLLRGTIEQGTTKIDAALADTLADAIAQEARKAPFRTRGEIVTRVLGRTGTADLLGKTRKTEREASVRALAELGSTRTWNFLVDLVVQSGQLATSAQNGSDFIVQAEQRYWVHVTIDRMTGKAVDVLWEKVKE